jgi:hypothetical protein
MARSALKRPSARIGDPNANQFYRRAAGDGLALYRREAFTDEPRDHRRVESVSEREQVLCNAVRNAREQRQCLALLLAEAWFFGGTPIRTAVSESFAVDGRQTDIGYKKFL